MTEKLAAWHSAVDAELASMGIPHQKAKPEQISRARANARDKHPDLYAEMLAEPVELLEIEEREIMKRLTEIQTQQGGTKPENPSENERGN